MSKQNPQRLTAAFLKNFKPNPANAKFADYEINLSAMKDSGLPTGVRCLVSKSGNKRFLLRYISALSRVRKRLLVLVSIPKPTY
ncbi:Arm DNA-binding domain-containing protein [Aliivibrio fischeri]|uniref:Arm DNA-binding domain-containing protein n=1 Tax=Aliivibrio fischeri TaxID=668 RepID=UPI001F269D70|nr:Arm DNA-binding domain-containing protein [Aliivibrio fischeri]MCE7567795.1 Arm DNA-binding domain-containing protein [Aliivibrio fischeri]